jgi:hypothetical protein
MAKKINGVPIDFCKGDHPHCYDVKSLIEELKRLPKDLRVRIDYKLGAELVVYNVNFEDRHLSFREIQDEY